METQEIFRVQQPVGAYGVPARVPGRICRECPTKLSSYEPWRLRCSPCARRRHLAEAAVVSLWLLAQQKIDGLPGEMRDKDRNRSVRRIRRKAVALSVGILSAPRSGYQGTRAEIQELLPFQSKGLMNRFPKLWQGLIEDGCIEHKPDSNEYRLVRLPDVEVDDGIYNEMLRYGSVPLEPEHLLPIYDPSNN